ncbi:MAG: SctK family type III secretion system sorting platform protein [Rhizobacter sp.]|nr:SctK family type III secretion system sorting platform protein [Rhizobacter sp.]
MAAPARDLMRLLMRHNLHPELDLHPSWLPPEWPARHRHIDRLGPAGQGVLADLLRRDGGAATEPRYRFDAPASRLALVDGPSLRRLAAYTGLCAHKPLLRQRGLGAALRRQARRLDADAADFVAERMPHLSELRMNVSALQQRPQAAGRVVMDRGYRLLLATLAGEGEGVLQRVQRKLPRRVSALGLPTLTPRQTTQLQEVMLQCLIPERLPAWDWLF